MPSPAKALCQALQSRGKEKAPSLRTRSQRPNEELTCSHSAVHSFIQRLFTEHLLCTRNRAKGQLSKEGNQEFSLGLAAEHEDIFPHPRQSQRSLRYPQTVSLWSPNIPNNERRYTALNGILEADHRQVNSTGKRPAVSYVVMVFLSPGPLAS